MAESIHEKLKRVRRPRVHITYEVETEGAEVLRELPFVVGVIGDFSGDPTQPLRPLAERKFIQIDRDNFNEVMTRMTPGLNIRVANKLADDGSEMAVQLKFDAIEDFEPARVAEQPPALVPQRHPPSTVIVMKPVPPAKHPTTTAHRAPAKPMLRQLTGDDSCPACIQACHRCGALPARRWR